MRWLKLITIILGLTCVAYSIEIVAKERSPGCNPVPENDEVILKVTSYLLTVNTVLFEHNFCSVNQREFHLSSD